MVSSVYVLRDTLHFVDKQMAHHLWVIYIFCSTKLSKFYLIVMCAELWTGYIEFVSVNGQFVFGKYTKRMALSYNTNKTISIQLYVCDHHGHRGGFHINLFAFCLLRYTYISIRYLQVCQNQGARRDGKLSIDGNFFSIFYAIRKINSHELALISKATLQQSIRRKHGL